MPANECIPYHRPGADVTAEASGAVTGKRFVAIAGDRTAAGNYLAETATAAEGPIFGVAGYDAADGDLFPVICGPGHIVPVTAEAAIAAGAEVQVGANGQAITLAAGVAVGQCLSAAAIGEDARIELY